MRNQVAQTSPSVKNVAQTSPSVKNVAQTPPSVHEKMAQKHKKPLSVNEFIIKRRNLPHWQNPGCVYFITFRTYKGIILDDTSKQIIYDAIIYQDKKKCRLYSFVIMPDHVHIILQPIEINQGQYINLSLIMQAIKGFASKQIIKHINIMNTQTPPSVLPKTIADTQTGASVLPIKHIFQSESFDRIIRNKEELNEKMNYILNNPVKNGLIDNGFNYNWYYLNKEEISIM